MADLHVAQTVAMGEHGQPWSLCLSPDERYIIVGCSDGKILVMSAVLFGGGGVLLLTGGCGLVAARHCADLHRLGRVRQRAGAAPEAGACRSRWVGLVEGGEVEAMEDLHCNATQPHALDNIIWSWPNT